MTKTPSGTKLPPQYGNLYTLGHGAYSDALVLPESDALAEQALERVPHLSETDRIAVRDWAIAQIRVWRLAAYVEKHGEFDAKGRIRPALDHLRRWMSRAETARSRLGLDPLSRVSLAVDEARFAESLRELAREDLAEGRRLKEEAEKRLGAG